MPSAHAANFIATEGTEDELRGFLTQAASNGVDDTIDLNGKTVVLSDQLLVSLDEGNINAKLTLRNGTLERPVGATLYRLLEVARNPSNNDPFIPFVTFDNMTFRNGRFGAGSVFFNTDGGGAVLAGRTIEVVNSVFENNTLIGNGSGGAVLARRGIIVRSSEFRSNSALSDRIHLVVVARGGAITIQGDYPNEIVDSYFVNNAADQGGAINFDFVIDGSARSKINRSTFEANRSILQPGGAIWHRSRALTVAASTFSQNFSINGGSAIYSQTSQPAALEIRFSTLVDNSGSAAIRGFLKDAGVTKIDGSLLFNSIDGNCSGFDNSSIFFNPPTVIEGEVNLGNDLSCGTAISEVSSAEDIFAAPLAFNGGLTPTFRIKENGAADDAYFDNTTDSGTTFSCIDFPTDQRGNDRLADAACDIGAFELLADERDPDGDGVLTGGDNCPVDPNPGQEDQDNDSIGDACDTIDNRDDDGDLIDNFEDNCPMIANFNQLDSDMDGLGDACDPIDNGDGDFDGVENFIDNCEFIGNPNQLDTDLDGAGNACDDDDDNDTVLDEIDNCPLAPNDQQIDIDGDGIGDVCDSMIGNAPMCEGHTATIYVGLDNTIVGGPNAGDTYTGTLVGTTGADVMVGTIGADLIIGNHGNDIMCGLAGNDELRGQNGADLMYGGNGQDLFNGGRGNDVMYGGNGRDVMRGYNGNDTLFGGAGNDVLVGNQGTDSADGGPGRDRCTAFESRTACER